MEVDPPGQQPTNHVVRFSLPGEEEEDEEENPANQSAPSCLDCGRSMPACGRHCRHAGSWHSTYNDCSARCAWGLGPSNLGKRHWSCCFSTEYDTLCEKAAHRFEAMGAPAPQPSLGASDCPRYVINLDAPPEDRWRDVVVAYAEHIPAATELADQVLGGVGASLVQPFLAALTKTGHVFYGKEIQGIARASGVPVGKVVMLQIAYEAFAACTSIVVDGPDGYPLHIRSMDWELAQLKALTIELDFVRDGQVVFRGSSWAGYVGVLTGVRPGAFSISVNYRRTERGHEEPVKALLGNIRRGLARHWPVSFLLREVLSSVADFDRAVQALTASELMAPTYFTICGVRPGEGAVVTRERQGQDANAVTHRLRDGPCIQVNMDAWRVCTHNGDDDWQDICASRHRWNFARQALATCGDGSGAASLDELWLLMSTPPCLAHDTIYVSAMIPSTGHLATRVRALQEQKNLGQRRFDPERAARRVVPVGAAVRFALH